MRKLRFIALAVFVLFTAVAIGGRIYVARQLQLHMLKVRPQSAKTPQQYGAPYEELTIRSGGRALKAFYVAPPAGSHASVLIFHGNDESIASWSPVQGLLYTHGLGSMVFDYSGFGHSEGKPILDLARADGIAAWNVFRDKLPPGTRACGYGLSLGTGILLEDASQVAKAPDCIVVYGAPASALGAAAHGHLVPRWLVPVLPDMLESVKNAAHLPAPLLVVHGESDERFPVDDARAIAEAAHAKLIVLPGFRHAQPVVHPDDAGWHDAIAFIRGE